MMRTVITLLLVVVAVVLFFAFTKPTFDGTKKIEAQIGQYNLALDKATELQRLKQSLLSRYNAFSPADVDRLHKLLPDHVDNVRLVLDLDTLASRHGLALQNVVVSPAAKTSGTEITALGPDVQPYDSLMLSFATIGGYEQYVRFLDDLEHSLRIVDVQSLKMDAAADTGIYRFDMTLRTYWLK